MATVVARLPDDLRDDLKPPMGPVFTDAEALLAAAGEPLVAVGDVVTAHLVRAGRRPDVAVVDGRTEREPAPDAVAELVPEADVRVENPAATLTVELVEAMGVALDSADRTTIYVDGEEDLAVLPALLLAPTGSSIVYGQPGEGMVAVRVDADVQERAREWLAVMATDAERLWRLLDR
ncbi:MAG: GTP-dependent dephospho-CoA kinase family protein [Halobacteriales archaeon]|nr:GTP-dependent dephospho-CoA kinase family protein [Halobacteriales archaeon]